MLVNFIGRGEKSFFFVGRREEDFFFWFNEISGCVGGRVCIGFVVF